MDLFNKLQKLQTCGYNSNLEISVKKIKVKKYIFKSYFSQFMFIFILFFYLSIGKNITFHLIYKTFKSHR